MLFIFILNSEIKNAHKYIGMLEKLRLYKYPKRGWTKGASLWYARSVDIGQKAVARKFRKK